MAQVPKPISSTFSDIFSELNSNVTQITDAQNNTIELDRNNGNYWYGAYPDTELITDKDRYPIGILDTPNYEEEITGLHTNTINLSASISVLSTRKDQAPKFIEDAVWHIRDNMDSFDRLHSFEVGSSSQQTLVSGRGDMKIHEYTVPLTFEMIVDP